MISNYESEQVTAVETCESCGSDGDATYYEKCYTTATEIKYGISCHFKCRSCSHETESDYNHLKETPEVVQAMFITLHGLWTVSVEPQHRMKALISLKAFPSENFNAKKILPLLSTTKIKAQAVALHLNKNGIPAIISAIKLSSPVLQAFSSGIRCLASPTRSKPVGSSVGSLEVFGNEHSANIHRMATGPRVRSDA
jgi:hypothetical protein